MLVPNLANKLFQNIFHGDNAQRAAEIVNNNRNVRFFELQRFKDVANFRMLIHEQRRRHDLRNGSLGHLAVYVEVLLMKHAHNLVNRIAIHQQTREAGLREHLRNVLVAIGNVHRLYLNAVR